MEVRELKEKAAEENEMEEKDGKRKRERFKFLVKESD